MSPLQPSAFRASVWLKGLGLALLDLLFPPRCAGCGRVGVLFCAACQAQIEPIAPPVCLRCGRPHRGAGLCADCRRSASCLDEIAAAAVFAGTLRQAIHAFKYDNGRALAPILGARLAENWRVARRSADVIIPVPLHAARLAERGYNQSVLLARILAEATGVPIREDVLVRHKATQQQALLNAAERRANVKDAFICQGDVGNLRVVLVDDVCTTGSTLEACAEALRGAGAASVWALTLARARWEPGQPAPDRM
jgi:ComF family protein